MTDTVALSPAIQAFDAVAARFDTRFGAWRSVAAQRRAVRDQLGARTNWEETGDLAMLFQGTYTTAFYRRLRDVLHAEVANGAIDAGRWFALAEEEAAHRSLRPTEIADAAR